MPEDPIGTTRLIESAVDDLALAQPPAIQTSPGQVKSEEGSTGDFDDSINSFDFVASHASYFDPMRR